MLVIVVRQNVQCTIQNVLENNLIMNHQRTIIIQSIRKSLNTFVEIAILEHQRKISIYDPSQESTDGAILVGPPAIRVANPAKNL